jgi:uncharacterized protein YutE (UPF0331/DUF86 family)
VDIVDVNEAPDPILGEVFKGQRLLGDDTAYAQLLTRHLLNTAVPLRERILKERRDRWIRYIGRKTGIPPALRSAYRRKKAVGFRNIAIHQYEAINWEIVYAVCEHSILDFRQFALEISRYARL